MPTKITRDEYMALRSAGDLSKFFLCPTPTPRLHWLCKGNGPWEPNGREWHEKNVAECDAHNAKLKASGDYYEWGWDNADSA